MTYKELLKEGESALAKAQVPEPGLDAWYLLSRAFAIDRVRYLMDKDRPLKEEDVTEACRLYRAMIERRRQRIPLQHILGDQEFMGLTFQVSEHVLVPRQDTETLVEQVLADYRGAQPRILDMCTGSGCIAVSLASLGRFEQVDAVDLSSEALKVAEQNAGQNGCRIHFMRGDLFSPVKGRYDVIVSNPPYIPSGEIEVLEPEVRDYEPRLALDGSADGLAFYRRLSKEAGSYLNDGGRIYFEIGCDQAADVSGLLAAEGFEQIIVVKDAAGLDRVVKAAWKVI